MPFDLILFATCALVGVRLQRAERGERIRDRLWRINYAALIPLAAAYAFLTIDIDRELLATMACGLVAWWLTVLVAGLWARAVAPTRSMRGALWLVGAFPNTGFLGFPLAYLAYGDDGLRLAIVYDQLSLVVPAIVVSTLIAHHHADRDDAGEERSALATTLHELAVSPPLWTVVVLLVLRATILPEPLDLAGLGAVVGHVAGATGFLLLGLSMPLHGFAHDRREVATTSGAMLIRVAVAPALVWLVATVAGIDAPAAIYLIAAMPTAFHALIVARVHGLEVAVLRLAVLVTSAVMIAATVLIAATGS